MPTKYQIFVSSTYEDLKVERDRVIQGVLEMGHIPVGMEMFSAADEQQWQIIARHIEESDYYVVIVAHRYGSMDGAVSFTRKEYEHAVAHNVPTIGFVIEPDAAWPGDRVDTDAATVERLKDFKELVMQKPVGFWSNADDLYGKASVALVKAMTAQPRTGWVRASSAVGPEVTAEISRLSSENAALRSRIGELQDQSERDAASELAELWAQMKANKWEYVARFTGNTGWDDAKPISYADVFWILAPNMVVESSAARMDELLALHSRQISASDPDENASQADQRKLSAKAIPINERNALLADFMMLGVMEPSTKRHPVADTAEYWSLSTLGQELLKSRKKHAFASTGRDENSAVGAP